MENIMQVANDTVFSVWFLIGAALVFFMQCGFAMVESGFTRAKNAGNIIMKNLMDFCIGTVVFMLLGFGLMMAEDYVMGIIGVPNLDIFTDFSNFDSSNFVFNLVFCATTATIVSGAMAERTKFISYCVYSAAISAIVYPIEAGWIWNSNGWLAKLDFIDFAGSSAIHMVGGLSALIGASILGARIGKYTRDPKTGKVTKVNAIPGHSLTLGALGVFILWFGWYGFNGAAAGDASELAKIFVTTTIAPGVATVVTMIFTWVKNGKPDVSMSLNGSLAGLVAITAGCASVDALGATIIGLVAGILVVVCVEGLDMKLHIDDPVGAVGVHFANGVWGTIACGLFATDTGLFYGGGFRQLGVQLLGIVAVCAWTAVTMYLVFKIIDKTIGLRVSKQEELDGLDSHEHGLPSAYPEFEPAIPQTTIGSEDYDSPMGDVPVSKAIEVQSIPAGFTEATTNVPIAADGTKLTKVEIICKDRMFESLKTALMNIGISGITVTHVMGCGIQKGKPEYYRGIEIEPNLLPKIQVEVVVSKVPVRQVIETAKKALYTGHIGDGKIFIYNVENVIKVRTGEEGYCALQ